MIIAINNNKGGILKTTTVTNLAGVLVSKKKKVLIVDADAQSNVVMSFGINPDDCRTTLLDVLTSSLPAEDTIIKINDYLDILPSSPDLIGLDFKVIGNKTGEYPEPFMLMKRALQHLESQYDFILIDTPPALSLIVGNAFAWADRVLIPYKPEYYSMRSLVSVVDTIREFTMDFNPKLDILGILYTIVKARTNLHNDVSGQTKEFAHERDIHIFKTIIPDSMDFAKSVAYKQLPATMVYKKLSKKLYYDTAQVYYDLWEEIDAQLDKEGVR